jgi:hypothetical protein
MRIFELIARRASAERKQRPVQGHGSAVQSVTVTTLWNRFRASWSGRVTCVVAAAALAALGGARASAGSLVDDFEDLTGWSVSASPWAKLEIAHDLGHSGMSMRLDFDFHGGGGYVLARKPFPLKLPSNYAFTFQIRGDAPANNFELKLVDKDGNVWWSRHRDFAFPDDWQQIAIRKNRIEFAWGPGGGGSPARIEYIELAITPGEGGKGSVWIDDLALEEREPTAVPGVKPEVRASTYVPGYEPEHVLDDNLETRWRSGSVAPDQWLLIDFTRPREYGGLVIDWDADDYATAYEIEVSNDGESWSPVYSCTAGNGGRDYVYIHDGESRLIRMVLRQSSRGQGYGVRQLALKPYSFSASPNQFFAAIAAEAPLGTYPKYFSDKQTYWTVVGVGGDSREATLNEEGMLEVERGGFSIEPFLYADGQLITWAAVHTNQELEQGYLPIPSVHWLHDRLVLGVTALAAGRPGASALYARYRVENRSDALQHVILFLALRPFQVVPPWQSLNMVGGVTPIRELLFDARTVWVNGEKPVVALTPPDRFGAASFQEGLLSDFLSHGRLPRRERVSDPFGYAWGALQYHLDLEAGSHEDVYVAVPFHEHDEIVRAMAGGEGAEAHYRRRHDETSREWERKLARVELQAPVDGAHLIAKAKTALAHILINRDGPMLQPGARNYARSWIRDGAFSSTALLAMGFTEEPREFLRWFAGYQLPDGRIPCCVDHRGADLVPEHDSHGQFIFAVAEYYRFTRDVGFLAEMWPNVVRAADAIGALRSERTTEAYRQPDTEAYFGLLPESISHEGYSAHPVHSYWDGFFALRGLKDVVTLAEVMVDDEAAARFAALRDAFRRDLYASIARVMEQHRIDYIPGSAELADFDATSTAIAVSPVGELVNLPRPALEQTFERYYAHVQERLQHPLGQEAYTPYELRNVAALIHMGERERANEILDLLVDDQRPTGWNQWQEVVWSDPTTPRFIGDMPHTWIGATFIRSVRTMFVHEAEADGALVIAAGLPASWVLNESGVSVRRLPTHFGVLSFTLAAAGENALRLRLAGDLAPPPGGIIVRPPLPRPLKAVTVNGNALGTFTADSATMREFPADVLLEY